MSMPGFDRRVDFVRSAGMVRQYFNAGFRFVRSELVRNQSVHPHLIPCSRLRVRHLLGNAGRALANPSAVHPNLDSGLNQAGSDGQWKRTDGPAAAARSGQSKASDSENRRLLIHSWRNSVSSACCCRSRLLRPALVSGLVALVTLLTVKQVLLHRHAREQAASRTYRIGNQQASCTAVYVEVVSCLLLPCCFYQVVRLAE